MIAFPSIDPVAIALGPVKVHWYGLMYLFAFASAWWLGRRRAASANSIVKPEQIDDLIFYGALGVVLGGRIGSVIFYNFDSFLQNPLYLFKIWEGGMSFHGGFIGVLVAMGKAVCLSTAVLSACWWRWRFFVENWAAGFSN
jgi:phosphatidylglycerol:prolipoprotein diacylglycerol transferase